MTCSGFVFTTVLEGKIYWLSKLVQPIFGGVTLEDRTKE